MSVEQNEETTTEMNERELARRHAALHKRALICYLGQRSPCIPDDSRQCTLCSQLVKADCACRIEE